MKCGHYYMGKKLQHIWPTVHECSKMHHKSHIEYNLYLLSGAFYIIYIYIYTQHIYPSIY